MGGYLAKPVTRTSKQDGQGRDGNLQYGSASMQGWRPKMEDAHTVRFDLDSSKRNNAIDGVFGIFDGHGGKEVALYCSKHLIDALTNISMYKRDEDIGMCLRESFMRIDCSLLTSRGQSELKRLRAEDDHVICIHRELFPLLGAPRPAVPEQRKPEASIPGRKPKQASASQPIDSDEDSLEDDSSASDSDGGSDDATEAAAPVVPVRPSKNLKRKPADQAGPGATPSERSAKRTRPAFLNTSHPIWERIRQIGEERGVNKRRSTSTSSTASGGSRSSLHSTDSLTSTGTAQTPASQSPEQAQAKSRGPALNDPSEKTCRSGVGLEILPRHKADKHLNDPNMVCINKDDVAPKRAGYESGCTALVAAVEATSNPDVKRLVVVNAGDSRCVLSRAGRAVEMSHDHGLHLQAERERVLRAGGVITEDGRINGKLNLSRAIGDHQFKTRRDMQLKEQMVTSFADIESTLVRRGEDEFMVLACDGIWDAMSSQQVVNFVRERIAMGVPLPEIGEQICRNCLARDVENDPGTDNMSVLICKLFS